MTSVSSEKQITQKGFGTEGAKSFFFLSFFIINKIGVCPYVSLNDLEVLTVSTSITSLTDEG